MKKYCYFLLLFLSLSTIVFAKTNDNIKTLLTLKLYFEPNDQFQKLTYILTLPKNEYYSFYPGSDLPRWRVVNDNVLQGEFHPVELMNIRIHANDHALKKNNNIERDTARLTVIDPVQARVIWQGKFNYHDSANNKINAVTEIDNKKYYDTTLKIDREERIVSWETNPRK